MATGFGVLLAGVAVLILALNSGKPQNVAAAAQPAHAATPVGPPPAPVGHFTPSPPPAPPVTHPAKNNPPAEKTPPPPLPSRPPAEKRPPVAAAPGPPVVQRQAEPLVKKAEANLERVKESIALVEGKRGKGTGFVLHPGILATNNHVIQDNYIDDVRARFISEANPLAEPIPVKLLYRNRKRDLALLALECPQAPLPLARPREFKGLKIAVVGHPSHLGGLVQQLHVVTEGVVEGLVISKDRPWYHLRADAAPGNSGGPVVDRQTGEVVGVLTFGVRQQAEDRDARRSRRAPPHVTSQAEAMDTFCIPVAHLAEALAKVESMKDRELMSQQATARYAAELATLQVARLAVAAKKVAQRQVDRNGNDVAAAEDYAETHKGLMAVLKPALQTVSTSPHLNTATREAVRRLVETSKQMGTMAVQPAGAPQVYVAKFNGLVKKYQGALKVLFKELDLPDSVEVSPLD